MTQHKSPEDFMLEMDHLYVKPLGTTKRIADDNDDDIKSVEPSTKKLRE